MKELTQDAIQENVETKKRGRYRSHPRCSTNYYWDVTRRKQNYILLLDLTQRKMKKNKNYNKDKEKKNRNF